MASSCRRQDGSLFFHVELQADGELIGVFTSRTTQEVDQPAKRSNLVWKCRCAICLHVRVWSDKMHFPSKP